MVRQTRFKNCHARTFTVSDHQYIDVVAYQPRSSKHRRIENAYEFAFDLDHYLDQPEEFEDDIKVKSHGTCRLTFQVKISFLHKTKLLHLIQGGPKVDIQLLNYFLYALKLLAVHLMELVKYHKHCLFF